MKRYSRGKSRNQGIADFISGSLKKYTKRCGFSFCILKTSGIQRFSIYKKMHGDCIKITVQLCVSLTKKMHKAGQSISQQ